MSHYVLPANSLMYHVHQYLIIDSTVHKMKSISQSLCAFFMMGMYGNYTEASHLEKQYENFLLNGNIEINIDPMYHTYLQNIRDIYYTNSRLIVSAKKIVYKDKDNNSKFTSMNCHVLYNEDNTDTCFLVENSIIKEVDKKSIVTKHEVIYPVPIQYTNKKQETKNKTVYFISDDVDHWYVVEKEDTLKFKTLFKNKMNIVFSS